jgi:5-oxoprolinase (ATP-hydrolysing)
VIATHPEFSPGDVFVTNDPAFGGSHLPDLTVVLPVHDGDGVLRFFSATRGHHSDVGGVTPGSMPAFSSTLADEGCIFSALRVACAGVLDTELVLRTLAQGPYPARRPQENLADLSSQISAAELGARRLLDLARAQGLSKVERYMQAVQDLAAASVARALREFADGDYTFRDQLDDGTTLEVALVIQ